MAQTQIEPVLAPRGGLRLDLPSDLISPLEMTDCANVFFEDGLVKKRYGYKRMGGNLPLHGAVMGSDQYYKFGGQNYLLVMTTKDIYQWNPVTSEWDSIGVGTGASGAYGAGVYGSRAYGMQPNAYGARAYGESFYGSQKGSIFTGTDADPFSYDYIRKLTESEPWWVCTNGVDNIKKYNGENLVDLGGSPPIAKRLVAFKDYLHLLDVTEGGNRFPQRDRWSDTGNPENWLTGNASYKDLPGADWISNGMKFKGDYMVVLKERSIEVGYATADEEIFEFDCKVTGAGCAAPNTIESLGDEIIFLGWDDVYVFNGIDYEPIGTPIQRELFRTLNPEQIGRCFGVIIEEQKEYWLFVPSTRSTYPDMAWCFNYNLNKWTRHTFGNYITAFGYYFLERAMTWNDLVGSWDSQAWRWDDRTILSHAPTTLFGDVDGYVFEYDKLTNNDDGTAIDAYFDTKDFVRRDPNTGRVVRQRILQLDVYYTGQSLDVSYSIDKGRNWTAIGTLPASTNMEIARSLYLRLDCERVRYRFRNANLNQHFEFNSANIYWQFAGTRLN